MPLSPNILIPLETKLENFFGVCSKVTKMVFASLFTTITTIFFILVLVPNIWIFKKLANIKDVAFRIFVSATVFGIFIPIIIYCLILLIIYRIIVTCIIWMYHGRKFIRMLDGRNRIYTVQTTSPHVILFLIKYNQPLDFYAKISHIIGKTLKERLPNDRVFSTISSCLGYDYLIKNEVPFTEYVKPLPLFTGDNLDDNSLLNAIEQYNEGPLPGKNSGLWEVFIGTQKIIWRTPDGDEVGEGFYPIVLRFHPCVSNILNIMNTILYVPYVEGDEENETGGSRLGTKTKHTKLQKLSNCIRKTGYFFMSPSVFLVNALGMKNEDRENNFLYGPALSSKKTFCVFDESTPYNVDLIKRIKEKFPGTTFQDVLLTAFTCSLEEYYAKVLGGTPASRPSFILSENYVSTRPIENVQEDPINRSSTIMLKLPIGLRCKVGEIPMVCMLRAISKERKLLKDSVESKVHYEMLKTFFTYLPSPLLRLFINKYKFTTIINNLLGPNEVRAIDGHTISNVYIWTPHRGNTGISLTIATYEGRLQFTLSVDKVLIPKREDVQNVVDGIYKNLVTMDNIQQHEIIAV